MLLGNIHFMTRESVGKEKQFKLQKDWASCKRVTPGTLYEKYLPIGSFFSADVYYNFRGVLLQKIVLLQHIITEITLRTSIFISRTILCLSNATSIY